MAKKAKFRKNKKMTPMFFVALFNFLIIILLVTYIIYLRFIPYTTLEYDGYAVSGKDIANNLLNTNFDVDHSVKALQVKDQDSIYENFLCCFCTGYRSCKLEIFFLHNRAVFFRQVVFKYFF